MFTRKTRTQRALKKLKSSGKSISGGARSAGKQLSTFVSDYRAVTIGAAVVATGIGLFTLLRSRERY